MVKGNCMEIALFSIFSRKRKKKKKSRSGSKLGFFWILGQVRTRECCGQQVLIAKFVFWSVMLMSHDGILLQVVRYFLPCNTLCSDMISKQQAKIFFPPFFRLWIHSCLCDFFWYSGVKNQTNKKKQQYIFWILLVL